MGKLELIKSENSRASTSRKRRNGILKKAQELRTLCGVPVSVIINENKPNSQRGPQLVTHNYQPEEVTDCKSYKVVKHMHETLADFYSQKTKQLKKKTAELRQRNYDARVPRLYEKLNGMPRGELVGLVKTLEHKMADVEKIIRLKQIAVRDDGRQLQQKALNPAQMLIALNPRSASTGRSMMYKNNGPLPSLPEEQNNMQAILQPSNPIGYHHHQHFNNGSMIMINGMPWTDYNIQSTLSTSKPLNYEETSRTVMWENHLQSRNYMDESVPFYDRMLPQLDDINGKPYTRNNGMMYQMSASYLEHKPILASQGN